MSKTVKVRAGDGLKVFFPLSVIAAPGRRTFVLEGDRVIELPASDRFVRRLILCGDLVRVDDGPKERRTRKRVEVTKNDDQP